MVYRLLWSHQLADQLSENDKVFNDLLTAAVDFPNHLQFDNAKGIKGEVAATGTYKNLIVLDASDIVQLGVAGTIVAVPADPTTNLGVATKAYVDGVQMFQTQPKVGVATGAGASFTTILSLTSTTRGRLKSIVHIRPGTGGSSTVTVRITIDGGAAVTITSSSVAIDKCRALSPGLVWTGTDQTYEGDASTICDISFNTSILVEATAEGNAGTLNIGYEKIP